VDALLLPFIATALAEIGSPTQLLAMLLSARFGARGHVLGGIAAAALANSLIGAAGGRAIHGLVNARAAALMVALSLIATGAAALLRAKPPGLARYGGAGPFLASFLGFLILGFGDNSQFLALTLAARTDSLWLTALGATAGIMAAVAPAVMVGQALPGTIPLRGLRRGAGILFLCAGAVVAVQALDLA